MACGGARAETNRKNDRNKNISATTSGRASSSKESRMQRRYSTAGYDLTPLSAEELKRWQLKLDPQQLCVTRDAATEPAHTGKYADSMAHGIYVSVVGGLPLFRSEDKFISQCGWPSFSAPLSPDHIVEKIDRSHGMVRTEVLDARSGAHLGHLFDDGPPPTHKRYCINSAALNFIPRGQPIPKESQPALETAYFAGGCFWGVEDRFAKIPGVVDAVSGYQGGRIDRPSYERVSSGDTGHAETVKVVFDRHLVAYKTLVERFFAMHDPTTPNRQGPDVGTQYRSAIFTASEEQLKTARQAVDQLQKDSRFQGRRIVTELQPAGPFYEAEEYHQNYHAKHGGSCE